MASINYVLLLVAVWVSLVCGSVQFTSNFSASVINGNSWQFNGVALSQFSLAGAWLGANFQSADVTGDAKTGIVDVVTGSAYVAISSLPFSFLSYFKGSYNLDFSIGPDFAGANVSASAGYVGTAYIGLEETAPNGTVVATRSFSWTAGIFTDDGLSYSLTESKTGADNQLQYVTYTGTSNADDSLVVKFTFVVSSVAGIANGTIPIVPRSLESIVTISGYPYQSTQNSLSLALGVGTGGASVAASGKTIYAQGNAVYFSLSDTVVAEGKVQPVSVSAFTSGNVDASVGNSDFSGQLSARYGASANFSIVKVTFPAGANNIVYDPSLGAGVSAHEFSAAPTTVASLVLVLAALLLVTL